MKIVLSVALTLLLVGCGSQEEIKSELVESVKKVETKKVVEATKVPEIKTEVKEEVVPKELAIVQTGDAIFKSCSACHGNNAEKKALGKSQVIKGWESTKIINALNGYKAGTYGGAMKGLMKGQVLKLSDADIKEVAGYISKL